MLAAPPLLVRSRYPDLIRNTSGLIAYWRMRDLASSTVFRNELAGNGATMTGTPTPYQGTPIADGAGAKFNGTNQALSAAIDLSAYNKLSVSVWLWWDAFAQNDKLGFEYTPTSNTNAGNFYIDPNESTTAKFSVVMAQGDSVHYWQDLFTRPSAAVWHHYLFTYDRTVPVHTAYVDGAKQTLTTGRHDVGSVTGNFANSTLNFMSRNQASLWGAGRMSEFALFGGVLLNANDARHHYQSGVGW